MPAQIHYSQHDPFRSQEWIEAVIGAVRAAEASIEVFDYPGPGHLFTDSLPQEYDEPAAELLWQRVLAFAWQPAAELTPTLAWSASR